MGNQDITVVIVITDIVSDFGFRSFQIACAASSDRSIRITVVTGVSVDIDVEITVQVI